MNDHTYKIVEITGTSEKSSDEAVQNAITKASSTLRDLRWLEVIETRGKIERAQVARWQVTVKLGFTLE